VLEGNVEKPKNKEANKRNKKSRFVLYICEGLFVLNRIGKALIHHERAIIRRKQGMKEGRNGRLKEYGHFYL